VSTAALALAAVWPQSRTVLVAEVDPAGSALAPRFGLPYERGVSSLAPASRRRFAATEVPDHCQTLPVGLGRSEVLGLIGVRGAEQSRVLDRFWTAFAGAIATEEELDVLADCGRLGPDSPAMSVVTKAHMTLLLTRPDVEGVVQAQLRATALQEAGVEPERLAVVVVGKEPYGEAEVAEALDIPVIGMLVRDPKMAAILSGQKAGRRSRMSRAPLMRSARNLCDRLQEVVLPLPVVSPRWRRADSGELPAHVMALGADRDE
jgi:hypothetical protein